MQTPLTGQAALASEQVPELEPPPEPAQTQVRVVPQPVWPLSLVALPAVQPSGVLLLQTPLTGQAALVIEQVPELEPPPEPAHTQVRVAPQPVWPLSLVAVPAVQPSGVLLLQTPLTGQAALASEQLALLPPLAPLQVQVELPPQLPALLAVEVPAEQLN